MKKTLALLLVGIILAFTAACGRGAGKKGSQKAPSGQKTLKISYDTGEYGGDWMKKIADGFQQEHADIKIKLDPDDNINEDLLKAFSSGVGVPDVAVLRQTNWQYFVGKGWLSRLDKVYSSTVDGGTIMAKLQPGDRDFGKYNKDYYVLPWTSRVTGFVYNEKLFTDHNFSVPRTVSELNALLDEMKAVGVTPIAWAGKAPELWDNVVLGWWEQAEGSQGVKNYLAMQSPEVYRQPGRLAALQEFESLLSDSGNYLAGSENFTEQQMAAAFFKGRAAMIPETSDFYAKFKGMVPDSFSMGMMRLPAMDATKGPEMNNAGTEDFICVPQASASQSEAFGFLRYLYSDKALTTFEDATGVTQPVKGLYDGDDAFVQSVFDIWDTSDNVYLYSQNPIYYSTLHDWPYSGKPYLQIFSNSESAQSIFDKNYEAARQAFLNAGYKLPAESSAVSEP